MTNYHNRPKTDHNGTKRRRRRKKKTTEYRYGQTEKWTAKTTDGEDDGIETENPNGRKRRRRQQRGR